MNLSWWLAACGCGGAYGKGLTDASMSVHNGGQVAVMRVIFWMMQSKNKNARTKGESEWGLDLWCNEHYCVSYHITNN